MLHMYLQKNVTLSEVETCCYLANNKARKKKGNFGKVHENKPLCLQKEQQMLKCHKEIGSFRTLKEKHGNWKILNLSKEDYHSKHTVGKKDLGRSHENYTQSRTWSCRNRFKK